MSLVTLSSKRNNAVQRDTDPAIIKNHFKDGLVLREGTEVGLVSLTINKLNLYEVITGENDTFVWRIGAKTTYLQHTVTVDEGNYNGENLATEIQTKVNASTLLGNYKGEWVCTYDQTAQGGEGAFTINYGQKETPAAPTKQTYEAYDGGDVGNEPTFQNNGTAEASMFGSVNGAVDDFETGDNPLIVTGQKGIFPNEGDFQCIIRPQDGFTELDQREALRASGGIVDETIYTGGIASVQEGVFNVTSGTPATNGWSLEFVYEDGEPSTFWVYLGDGEWGSSLNGAVAASRANSTDFFFWNPVRGVWADTANGGRHGEVATAGAFYIKNAGVPFNVPQGNVGYGKSISGYVRNSLYKGRDNYPGDVNADILKTSPDGFDITVTCIDNAAKDGVEFSLGKMVQTAGSTFPNAGWRDNSAFVGDFTDLDPTSEFSGLPNIGGSPIANWTGFTYATDHISIRIEIVKVTSIKIYLAHDTAGDNVFTDEILVRQTDASGGFTSTLKEQFYPLRPCMAVSRGNQYFRSRYLLKGIYDDTEIVNPTDYTISDDTIASEELGDAPVGAVPANAQTLSALYKFGEIYASDAGGTAPSGGLPVADHTPQGNINNLLGFNRLYNFQAGQTTNSVISTNNPITTIAEPTLSLELPDFNIKGANGNTGDSMRVIAVVPKEELTTNEKTGTLHYYPSFPVMIDLNLPQEQIFYDLNAILRLPDGKVANDLINPTEITLLFKEGEESKQRRMMKEQAQLISSMMGNKQSAMIGGIGSGNPLI